MRALDEPLWQAKLGAQGAFTAGHLAGVGLVVVAGQMQHPMQYQYLQLHSKRVAAPSALAARCGNADGQIAGDFFLAWERRIRGEREHVGGFVDAAKLTVETANRLVRRKQDRDTAAQPNDSLRLGKETRQSSRGRHAMLRSCAPGGSSGA